MRNNLRSTFSSTRRVLSSKPKHNRTEQAIHAYHRLYKDKLDKEIENDYERQPPGVEPGAHRNKFLVKRLQQEPADVKKTIEESRRKARDTDTEARKIDVKWADEKDVDQAELDHRHRAIEYDEYVFI